MRVLVAGGTGFLGAAIVRRLEAEGAHVGVAARSRGVDLAGAQTADLLPRCDAIVHVAGTGAVTHVAVDRDAKRRRHLRITACLLDHARRCGARLVVSSTFVYGASAQVPASEDDPPAPHSDYTATRWHAEELCRSYASAHGVAVDVLRVFNAYGPGQPSGFVIPTIVAGAIRGRIRLADPAPRRDFVHVDDVARAFALAAGRGPGAGETINVGSGTSRSIESVARSAAAIAGGQVAIEWSGAKRTAEVPDARASIARAARVLGWTPSVGFEAGLAALIARARAAPGRPEVR